MSQPVILEVAVNGATRRAQNPNVPITPDEIAADCIACLDAGATIVHHHDDPRAFTEPGPAGMAALAHETFSKIQAVHPEALMYPTANFGAASVADRWDHHRILDDAGLLRLALVDPGSVNLGGTAADGTPTGSFVYIHTFDDIRYKLDACRDLGLAPSIAIFEPGFLRVILAYHHAGLLPTGSMVKLYFSGGTPLFGLPPTSWALDAYLMMLTGTHLQWAVAVLGGDVIESGVARDALDAGGHLRVGLEDYRGRDTPTNVELVQRAVALCRSVGRPLATPVEVETILGIPPRR
ncbi:MAG: 3-keto-5-aminohexanoate cleavage protein [Ilumatobacteraceae bacterium]